MATLHPTSTYNVETSLNTWLQTELATYTGPPAIPTTALTLTVPEAGINPPAFSLIHIPIGRNDRFQGRHGTAGENIMVAHAMMDVSVWVSRTAVTWQQDLMIMDAVVNQIAAANPTVNISSYATAASPSATIFRVLLGEVQTVQTVPDPNLDIERRRILITYDWHLRG